MFGRAISWMSWIVAIGCLAGCATFPTRSFLTRKAKPSNELVGETALVDMEESSNNQTTEPEPKSAEVSVSQLDTATKRRSAGGLFDVSSRPADGIDEIEAPPPKRSQRQPKRLEPSLTFDDLIPPQVASVQSPFAVSDVADSDSPPNVESFAESVGQESAVDERFSAAQEQVIQADFIEPGRGANIELAANERVRDSAKKTANSWDRLRDLVQPNRRATDPAPSEPTGLPTIQPGTSSGQLNRRHQSSQSSIPLTTETVPPPNGRAAPELWPGRWGQSAGANESSMQMLPGFVTPASGTDRPRVGAEPQPTGSQLLRNPASLGLQINSDLAGRLNNVPAPAGNWPGGAGALGSFGSSPELERLIAVTAGEVAAALPGETEIERQAYLRKHVQLRLLFWIAGQTDRALQPISGVDPTDQEFWQQMLWGMANYFDMQGMPDSAERATQTIAQLKTAALRLQANARLELKNVAFCHKIASFGNYQRFKRDEFTPGQPVLLYAEVCNFKSEPTSDGQFRTLMKSTVEILEGSDRSRVIETIPFPPSEDRCRNHRHDYFHSYEFAVPTGLPSGPHVLRMTVEDQLGKKSAVSTLNFTVQ